jgi:putative pyruvate formate lyase activating enzyme
MGDAFTPSDRRLARDRAALADAALGDCRLCAWRCGVDRRSGRAGRCRAGAAARVFHEGIEWAGEAELVPTYVVSFSGCNMACSFCLTGDSSQDARAGLAASADALDAIAERVAAQAHRLRSVTILGGEPSIHLGAALALIARLPADLPVVWKTNAYASPEALDLLDGCVDVVLADLKFGDDGCARRLARVPDYLEAVRANLRWARTHARLIVRHLLMPGHDECCLAPTLAWLAEELPGTPLSLMSGYVPTFRARAELARANRADEVAAARAAAERAGLALAPWAMRAPGDAGGEAADEVLIDPDGRVCVDSASPALLACFARLEHEMRFGT